MNDGPNCPGCGATLRRLTCDHCGRTNFPPEIRKAIRPDPEADPKRRFEPRKVMR